MTRSKHGIETLDCGSRVFWDDYIVFGKQSVNNIIYPIYKVKIECSHCKSLRYVRTSSINAKRKGYRSGLCKSCSYLLRGELSKRLNLSRKQKYYDVDMFSHGYNYKTLESYSPKEQKILQPMTKLFGLAPRVAEHRAVIALSLGRPLTQDEQVHHKNGIRSDNRLQNLEMLTPSEHGKQHHLTGVMVSRLEEIRKKLIVWLL